MTPIEPALAERFAAEGFPDASVIGSGMEGVVYRLAPGTVAKVWHHQPVERVRVLQDFYRGILTAGLPIATPEIHEVWQVDDRCVSVEKEMLGPTLESREPLRVDRWPRTVAALTEVLGHFAAVPAVEALCKLPVLDETGPFSRPDQTWPEALRGLVTRRVECSAPVLRRAVARFDDKVQSVLRRLDELPPSRTGLVHGDLIPANVLVDEDLRPTAVLDFGFLSMHGDVAFDAAVTASIADMYGTNAHEVERDLETAFVRAFDLSPDVLTVYRAAYALITSTAYDAEGDDGHFAWCAAILERDDVCAALGVSAVQQ